MKQSAFLARLEAQKEREKLATLRFTRQLMIDCSTVALNNVFGFGADRLKKFADEVARVYENYADLINEDTADEEYSWESLDKKLKQICGENFTPWEERYK